MSAIGREEQQARARKVTRLLAAIRTYGKTHGPDALTADVLARLDDDGWAALAGLAHVNPPSATTRAQVIATVRAQEARA